LFYIAENKLLVGLYVSLTQSHTVLANP